MFSQRFIGLTVLVLLSVFALVGCQTSPVTPEPLVTTVTKYVLLKPSNDLLADCPINAVPPDPTAYVAANDPGKIDLLRTYSIAQQKDATDCGSLHQILRDWYAQQDKLVNAPAAK